jgi:hypothetical protein
MQDAVVKSARVAKREREYNKQEDEQVKEFQQPKKIATEEGSSEDGYNPGLRFHVVSGNLEEELIDEMEVDYSACGCVGSICHKCATPVAPRKAQTDWELPLSTLLSPPPSPPPSPPYLPESPTLGKK